VHAYQKLVIQVSYRNVLKQLSSMSVSLYRLIVNQTDITSKSFQIKGNKNKADLYNSTNHQAVNIVDIGYENSTKVLAKSKNYQ
jgi:hypothetical protein